MDHHWFGDWHGAGWMLILWAVGVGTIVVLFTRDMASLRKKVDEDPESVLKRRFAKGEIDEQTYLRMLEKLRA
jgi:uncharacterized membrane protein